MEKINIVDAINKASDALIEHRQYFVMKNGTQPEKEKEKVLALIIGIVKRGIEK